MKKPKFGILDEDYRENRELEDKDQLLSNLDFFIHAYRNGQKPTLIWSHSKKAYELICRACEKHVDRLMEIGCGGGFGANMLSLHVPFIWGIDKNKLSVLFAQEAFTRPRLLFNHMDIVDQRTYIKPPENAFDCVIAVEVIEHVYDSNLFLTCMKQFGGEGATYWLTSPNRNHPALGKDRPINRAHVREWTVPEFRKYLRRFFRKVELFNTSGDYLKDFSEDLLMVARLRECI
jgi:2-polyprenyl-3-methyl-5-hydroxy-6-metoxy-1,4-benzoquinol methylase